MLMEYECLGVGEVQDTRWTAGYNPAKRPKPGATRLVHH